MFLTIFPLIIIINHFFPYMLINSKKLAISLFQYVLTIVCSEVCNFVNIYLILTYLVSFESYFHALQDPIISKSRAEYPFSSSVHIIVTLTWYVEVD